MTLIGSRKNTENRTINVDTTVTVYESRNIVTLLGVLHGTDSRIQNIKKPYHEIE